MYLYCLDDFKVEFDRLNSKKSYKALEQDLIDYFLGNIPTSAPNRMDCHSWFESTIYENLHL